MKVERTRRSHDVFRGCPPAQVKVEWSKPPAAAVDIVRLIVTDELWEGHQANDIYASKVLPEVAKALAGRDCLVVTPAGMLTADIAQAPPRSRDGLQSAIDDLVRRAAATDVAFELLLGVDGCVHRECTPVQLAVALVGRGRKVIIKRYPSPSEVAALTAWRICRDLEALPGWLKTDRTVAFRAGKGLGLICHEAVVFSARSRKNVVDPVRRSIRADISDQYAGCDLAFVQAHWIGGPRSGGSFKDSLARLSAQAKTAVFATFAPEAELERVAERFAPRGQHAARVGTLLVRATPA